MQSCNAYDNKQLVSLPTYLGYQMIPLHAIMILTFLTLKIKTYATHIVSLPAHRPRNGGHYNTPHNISTIFHTQKARPFDKAKKIKISELPDYNSKQSTSVHVNLPAHVVGWLPH